jgi:Response regulator containing a CheY-like receiver domain and an HTH DNA-binding domain
MPPRVTEPIRLALIDDYDIVLGGLAHMLDDYRDRVVIIEIDTNKPLIEDVDIALYDSFAQGEADTGQIDLLVNSPRARRVVVYTWSFHPELITSARRRGVDGYLSKTLSAAELVDALEAVHAGKVVISDPPPLVHSDPGLDWPGRLDGLTDRESEILALITQGRSNADIASLTYLSPNTIKSYIRSLYRKIDVTSRTKAVLWGIAHGFRPDHHRLDAWRDGDGTTVTTDPASKTSD